MANYIKTVAKHRRLTILRFLKDSPEYTSNGSILVEVCNDFGVTTSHDQVAGALEWLKANEMVVLDKNDDFIVVSATKYGIEIAKGISVHEGVKRPGPEG